MKPSQTSGLSDAARARIGRAGYFGYGVSVAALGVASLLWGDLAYLFQPVPRRMPFHHAIAYATGALLVAGGLGLLARKTMRIAALALTLNFFFAWLLLFHVPTVIAKPGIEDYWEGCGLNMMLLAGSAILFALSGPATSGGAARFSGERGVALARRVYALGIPLVGLNHLMEAQGATDFVPAWLPMRIGWVYLTGVGHIAAALAILFGVLAELAAVLEAAQITAFVVLAHIPAVFGAPKDRVQWGMLVYAAAIAAAAWLVAATIGDPRASWLRASSAGDAG